MELMVTVVKVYPNNTNQQDKAEQKSYNLCILIIKYCWCRIRQFNFLRCNLCSVLCFRALSEGDTLIQNTPTISFKTHTEIGYEETGRRALLRCCIPSEEFFSTLIIGALKYF